MTSIARLELETLFSLRPETIDSRWCDSEADGAMELGRTPRWIGASACRSVNKMLGTGQ